MHSNNFYNLILDLLSFLSKPSNSKWCMSIWDISSLSSSKVNSGLDSHRWIRRCYFLACFQHSGDRFNLTVRLKGIFAKTDGFWKVDPPASALEGVEHHAALKVTDSIWLFKATAIPGKCSSFIALQTSCGESQLAHFKGHTWNEKSKKERLCVVRTKSCWRFSFGVWCWGRRSVWPAAPSSSSFLHHYEWMLHRALLLI